MITDNCRQETKWSNQADTQLGNLHVFAVPTPYNDMYKEYEDVFIFKVRGM